MNLFDDCLTEKDRKKRFSILVKIAHPDSNINLSDEEKLVCNILFAEICKEREKIEKKISGTVEEAPDSINNSSIILNIKNELIECGIDPDEVFEALKNVAKKRADKFLKKHGMNIKDMPYVETFFDNFLNKFNEKNKENR